MIFMILLKWRFLGPSPGKISGNRTLSEQLGTIFEMYLSIIFIFNISVEILENQLIIAFTNLGQILDQFYKLGTPSI